MATHSSTLAWRIPWTEEPGRLQSMGSQESDLVTKEREREPINNVVIVSGGQQRDSVIHIHVFILSQTPLSSRLLHNIEQSSLWYIVGPCCLSILI